MSIGFFMQLTKRYHSPMTSIQIMNH